MYSWPPDSARDKARVETKTRTAPSSLNLITRYLRHLQSRRLSTSAVLHSKVRARRSAGIGSRHESKTSDARISFITSHLSYKRSESRPEIRMRIPVAQARCGLLNGGGSIVAVKSRVKLASKASRRLIANIPKG